MALAVRVIVTSAWSADLAQHASRSCGVYQQWQITPLASKFQAISCPSRSMCVAADAAGSVLTSTDPAVASTWRSVQVDNSGGQLCAPVTCRPGLSALSRPSTSLCLAGDWDGDVLASTDPAAIGQPWSSAYIDDHVVGAHHGGAEFQTAIDSIACPSTSLCVASDEDGYELVSQEPAAGPGAWRLAAPARASTTASVPVSSDGPLFGLTCASISLCVGLQGRPNLMALFSPISSQIYLSEDPLAGAWNPGVPDPGGRLEAVSCPTTALCLAVDSAGRVLAGARLTAVRVRELLPSAVLSPARPMVRSLLGLHRLVVRFEAPSAGRVSVRLLARAGSGRVRAVLARSQVTVPTATTVTIGARLARLGEALLRAGPHFRFT